MLQTRADREANDLICGSLKSSFPDLAVIGEEGEVDMAKIKSDSLVTTLDEDVIQRYQDKLPEDITNAKWEDLTVWVQDHAMLFAFSACGGIRTGSSKLQPVQWQ